LKKLKNYSSRKTCTGWYNFGRNFSVAFKSTSVKKNTTPGLNAKLHKKEAEIVAGAGQPGVVTLQPTWQVVVPTSS
jgi:hypothetical protein